MNEIQLRLFSMGDEGYRRFHGALVPTLPMERLIGVRTPELRRYAKELAQTDQALPFLNALPHAYYEENNLHGMLLDLSIRDFDELIKKLNAFLPYVDNWATCDMLSLRLFKKNPDKVRPYLESWLTSGQVYTVRFAIVTALKNHLDGAFEPELLRRLSALRSEEYYINMALAWYFAEALVKQPGAAMPVIEAKTLAPFVHNKAIQKAGESYRIPPETKAYLRSLSLAPPHPAKRQGPRQTRSPR